MATCDVISRVDMPLYLQPYVAPNTERMGDNQGTGEPIVSGHCHKEEVVLSNGYGDVHPSISGVSVSIEDVDASKPTMENGSKEEDATTNPGADIDNHVVNVHSTAYLMTKYEKKSVISNASSHSANTLESSSSLTLKTFFEEPAAVQKEEPVSDQQPQLPFKDIKTGTDLKPVLIRHINGGSFGEIFLARDKTTGKEMAVKIELSKSNQLLYEGNIYRKLEGGPGIPYVYWFGMQTSENNVMVMDLLGPNLYDLFMHCNRKFSLKTILNLGVQMISTIQFVHKKGYVHRDIKPDNFVVGRGGLANKLCLIDFGLAKKFSTGPRVRSGTSHYWVRNPVAGTLRYTSINTHLGQEASPRDDLESIGYTLLYLLKGALPWQGLDIEDPAEKLRAVLELKQRTPLEILCNDLPNEIFIYMNYVRHLRLYDTPDYGSIQVMFQDLAKANNLELDYIYDWTATLSNTDLKSGS